MKLPVLSQVLTNDPGPFATAYADVSRVAAAGDDEVALTARGARGELVEAGCPADVADAVQEALGASTHEGGEVARVVVASGQGVVFSALVRGRRPQPSTSWGALPDLAPWLADATLVVPFVLARVDHAGGEVSTYSDGATGPVRDEQEAGGDANFLHKTGADDHEGSVEEEWKRSADDVAAEIERQVTAGPSLVLLGGEPDAISEVKTKLGHLAAEVVELQGGRRNADGGDAAFDEEITEALRGHVVAANLDVLAQLKQRLGERAQGASSRGTSGVDAVLDALVVGQVDTLLLDPAAAAETSVTLSEHPGLSLGSVSSDGALPADQVLVALAALTDADVRVARAGTMEGAPAAALLRWDNTADAATTSSDDTH